MIYLFHQLNGFRHDNPAAFYTLLGFWVIMACAIINGTIYEKARRK